MLGSRRAKAAMALLLTLAAGCVDIVGFQTLYHIFTAHMTGATVHLSASAVEAHWADAWYGLAVIAAFIAGSVVGRGVIEYGARRRVRSIASATLLTQRPRSIVFFSHNRAPLPCETRPSLLTSVALQASTPKFRVERHRVMTAVLALQPALRPRNHRAKLVPDSAVRAAYD